MARLTDNWLPEELWRTVQATVPIVCIDVLAVRTTGADSEFGLILRDVPFAAPAWCLIGGRLERDESFETAIARQVSETLGAGMHACEEIPPQPSKVVVYEARRESDGPHDPRKHAVALTWSVRVTGEPSLYDVHGKPRGEALDFRWFERSQLPDVAYGFGQRSVVLELADAVQR
jgi:ADP-ribose pyrophosphatase YjhB (NUDIX family)